MLEERIILENGFFLEVFLFPRMEYRLSCSRINQPLVEYKSNGRKHSRSVSGRESAYEFKSVEKLRYDFERDAEDALRQD